MRACGVAHGALFAPGDSLRIEHKAAGRMRGEATITLDGARQSPREGVLNMSPTVLQLQGEGLDVGLGRRPGARAVPPTRPHRCVGYPARRRRAVLSTSQNRLCSVTGKVQSAPREAVR